MNYLQMNRRSPTWQNSSAYAVASIFIWWNNDSMNQELSLTANLLGDPGRAAIMLSLMDGLALPAGELASIANVAPQTASGHLARLIDGGLLSMERQGRHRYYRLSGSEVADAIEALLVLTTRQGSGEKAARKVTSPGTLAPCAHLLRASCRLARSSDCPGTGTPGVAAALRPEDLHGHSPWACLVPIARCDTDDVAPRRLALRCLDWTERRHHLAGTLGIAQMGYAGVFRNCKWLALPLKQLACRGSAQ